MAGRRGRAYASKRVQHVNCLRTARSFFRTPIRDMYLSLLLLSHSRFTSRTLQVTQILGCFVDSIIPIGIACPLFGSRIRCRRSNHDNLIHRAQTVSEQRTKLPRDSHVSGRIQRRSPHGWFRKLKLGCGFELDWPSLSVLPRQTGPHHRRQQSKVTLDTTPGGATREHACL